MADENEEQQQQQPPATPPSPATTASRGKDFLRIKKLETKCSQLEDENAGLKEYVTELETKVAETIKPGSVKPPTTTAKKSLIDEISEWLTS